MHGRTRLAIASAAVVAIGMGSASCGTGDDEGSTTRIVINQSAHSLSAAAMYVADRAGYFKKRDIDVEFVETGSGLKSITPLIKGSTQFCACIFSHPLEAQAAGTGEFGVVATLQQGYNHKIVVSKEVANEKGITVESPLDQRLKILRDLRVGITEVGASTDLVSRMAMDQAGLDPDKDAKIVAMGKPETMPSALARGRIDAYTMTPPVPEQAIHAGDAIVLADLTKDDISGISGAFYMGLTASKQYLKENKEAAVKVYQAVAEAETYLRENRAEAKKLLRKEFADLDKESFEASFETLKVLYPKTPKLDRDSIEAAIELSGEEDKVSFDDITDVSIAKAAAK